MNRDRLEADVNEKWLATPHIVLCKRVYLPKPHCWSTAHMLDLPVKYVRVRLQHIVCVYVSMPPT
jgi:hypothetical protein